MSNKKLESILNLIEIAESNLRAAKAMIGQVGPVSSSSRPATPHTPGPRSSDESTALEVVEGHFEGEGMIGDNGQMYLVPPNYASKTQLVVGDRMKWILTSEREIFKLIQPVARQRVTGTFSIEGDNYLVLVDDVPNPIKILKASATYAMKNLGLNIGDDVAILIPRDSTPTWGAFSSVVKSQDAASQPSTPAPQANTDELTSVDNLNLDGLGVEDANDYF